MLSTQTAAPKSAIPHRLTSFLIFKTNLTFLDVKSMGKIETAIQCRFIDKYLQVSNIQS
jgi:hypothetical protein